MTCVLNGFNLVYIYDTVIFQQGDAGLPGQKGPPGSQGPFVSNFTQTATLGNHVQFSCTNC